MPVKLNNDLSMKISRTSTIKYRPYFAVQNNVDLYIFIRFTKSHTTADLFFEIPICFSYITTQNFTNKH